MAFFSSPSLVDAIEDLLDRERQAVLGGNLDGLTRLIPEKIRLMERMARIRQPLGQIDGLKDKALQNQRLLEAVARGIESVSAHVTGLQTNKPPLRTYDATGASKEILQHRSTLEKRA